MADDLFSSLKEARRIADGLQFACRDPERKPNFTFAGGPAAEAYWEYFHPARVVSLLAALRAVLELADEAVLETIDASGAACSWDLDPAKVRAAISSSLSGKEKNDG